MNSVMKFDIEKSVRNSISMLESLHKEKAFKIINNKSKTLGDKLISIQKKAKGGFECKLFLEELHDFSFDQNIEKFGLTDEITLESSFGKYFIKKNSVDNLQSTLSIPQAVTFEITSFQSGLISDYENKIHRLIIPISIDPEFYTIETKVLKIEDTIIYSGIVQLSIDGKSYHLFSYSNRESKQKYLIIDSLQKSSLLDFKKEVTSIIMAYGFISGNLFLDEYYYLAEDESNAGYFTNICYDKLDSSIITNTPLLDPSDFRQYLENFQKSDKDARYWINSATFSNLCLKLSVNNTFFRCCKLILNGNENKHLLLKAGIYSIALETITNIVYEENTDKINPIANKEIANTIKSKFYEILKEHAKEIGDYGDKILSSKIENINQPTNSKKLSKPFELLGINLTEEDLEILNHRNKFLHGESPFEEKELEKKDHELIYISARLQLMVNILILKYIGYEGHIINYPAWIQYNLKKTPTEHLYKVI